MIVQVSKQRLNKTIEKHVYSILYQLIADIKSPLEVKVFLQDILSETELQVIAKRVSIALFLDKGRSYENIKSTLKVSSATIANVQDSMGNPGIQLALQKVKAEEWADNWADKITNIVGKIIPAK